MVSKISRRHIFGPLAGMLSLPPAILAAIGRPCPAGPLPEVAAALARMRRLRVEAIRIMAEWHGREWPGDWRLAPVSLAIVAAMEAEEAVVSAVCRASGTPASASAAAIVGGELIVALPDYLHIDDRAEFGVTRILIFPLASVAGIGGGL